MDAELQILLIYGGWRRGKDEHPRNNAAVIELADFELSAVAALRHDANVGRLDLIGEHQDTAKTAHDGVPDRWRAARHGGNEQQ